MNAIYRSHLQQISLETTPVLGILALWARLKTPLGREQDFPFRLSQRRVALITGRSERQVRRAWPELDRLFECVGSGEYVLRPAGWASPDSGQFEVLSPALSQRLFEVAKAGRAGWTDLRLALSLLSRVRTALHNRRESIVLKSEQTMQYLHLGATSLQRALERLEAAGLVRVLERGGRAYQTDMGVWRKPVRRLAAFCVLSAAVSRLPDITGSQTGHNGITPCKGDHKLEVTRSMTRARQTSPRQTFENRPAFAALCLDSVDLTLVRTLRETCWPSSSGHGGRWGDGRPLDGTPILPKLTERAALKLIALGNLTRAEDAITWLQQEDWGLRTAKNPAGYFIDLATRGETRPGKPSALERAWRIRAKRDRPPKPVRPDIVCAIPWAPAEDPGLRERTIQDCQSDYEAIASTSEVLTRSVETAVGSQVPCDLADLVDVAAQARAALEQLTGVCGLLEGLNEPLPKTFAEVERDLRKVAKRAEGPDVRSAVARRPAIARAEGKRRGREWMKVLRERLAG